MRFSSLYLRVRPLLSTKETSDATKMAAVRQYRPYFDESAFNSMIEDKKRSLENAERRIIERARIKAAPSGWTVLRFLQEMKFEGEPDEVAKFFTSFQDFLGCNAEDLMRVPSLKWRQCRQIYSYIQMFNLGLFPKKPDSMRGSVVTPGVVSRPWTEADDKQLLEAAEEFDDSYGDIVVYIAAALRRSEDEVCERLVEIKHAPRGRARTCELLLSKVMTPLMMNRDFMLVPPTLIVVPSEKNFPVHEPVADLVPSGFAKYVDS